MNYNLTRVNKKTIGSGVMRNLGDWLIIGIVVGLIVFCALLLVANAQTTTTVPEYDGWKHKTKLRGNWSADAPPGANDRLYEYDENNVKTGIYYEYNGYEWREKGDAKQEDFQTDEGLQY
jgi:hypothetical protein